MPSRCQSLSERPVASSTSSARAMRERSLTISRRAVAGSRRASSACSAAAPSLCTRARTCGADVGRHRRHRRQPRRQRLEIKPGAADQDWHAALRLRLVEHGGDVAQPLAGRIIHRRIDMTVQPVRRAALVLRRRSRGDDAQIAIDLHRVGIDDVPPSVRRAPRPAPTCRSRSGLQ